MDTIKSCILDIIYKLLANYKSILYTFNLFPVYVYFRNFINEKENHTKKLSSLISVDGTCIFLSSLIDGVIIIIIEFDEDPLSFQFKYYEIVYIYINKSHSCGYIWNYVVHLYAAQIIAVQHVVVAALN